MATKFATDADPSTEGQTVNACSDFKTVTAYRKYVTTCGFLGSDPKPPDAVQGWRMVGSAAECGHLYWFWLLEWEEGK